MTVRYRFDRNFYLGVFAHYPFFDKQISFNAGTYTFVRSILVCEMNQAKPVPLMPWRALPFAHSSKRKQKCICGESFRRLAKTESTDQRKVSFLPYARRRQFGGFSFITLTQ